MEIFILNSTRYKDEDSIEMGSRADLRKATRNMRMSYAVLTKLLQPFPRLMAEYQYEVGVVLGTGHGELETTKEFFKCYRQQGMARPLLFQNSLHNSTLGFLSQIFSFTGPTLTNSDHFFSGEKALETAMLLLKEKQILFCVALGIDALVPELSESLRLMYPAPVQLGEGCGAVLLASEEGKKMLES